MENQTPPSTAKIAMNYGGILGTASIGLSLIFYLLGEFGSKWGGWLSYALMIVMIVVGTKAYRDQHLGGYISYGKALGTGTLICIFAAIIVAFYNYIMLTFVDASLLEQVLMKAEEEVIAQNPTMSDDQLEQAMKMVEMFTNPLVMAITIVLTYGFLGFIFSLITSAFLKKENPAMPEA